MRCDDPGHKYIVDGYDGMGVQDIQFMKREGPGYPFNKGKHGGTNCQELIRVLIDRVKYLESQIPSTWNAVALMALRLALWAFESRAAERHKRPMIAPMESIEHYEHCRTCGHIGCKEH